MQKISADFIHDGQRLLSNHLLVFSEEGTIIDLVPAKQAGEADSHLEGIICPGFINTHCHLELSHLRGKVSEHTGLVSFLMTVMQDRSNFSKEKIQHAAATAESEMIENGIVAVGDISNTTDSIPVKQNSSLHYHSFVECIGVTDNKAQDSLERSRTIWNSFKEKGLSASLIPHAPYSVSQSLFELINANNGKIISIHNQETAAEDQLYKGSKSDFYHMFDTFGFDYSAFKPTGKSSLSSYLACFSRKQKLLLVHNTFTQKEDIQTAQQSDHEVFWCLCPNANLYIENKLPPVKALLQQKATIVLGTDSLASNHQLSILEEMKTIQYHDPKVSVEQLLKWATANGAQALQCEDTYGSFQKGKQPGILWIKNITETVVPTLTENTSIERLK